MKFKAPFTLIIVGPSSSGKSQWLKKFLHFSHVLIDPPPRHVLYAYGEINPIVLEHREKGISIFNGVPDQTTIKNLPRPSLLILDDLMFDMEDKYLNQLFTRGSHNWNCSIVLVCQTLYGRNLRTPRTNTHYMVIMKNNNLKQNISTIGHQMFPNQYNYFMDAYNDACSKPYGYIVIDSHPSSNDEDRLYTNIFPGERTVKYVPK
jgi:hypothetical protein